MEIENLSFSEEFKKNLFYLSATLFVAVAFIAGHNLITPEERVEVGTVEVWTECAGIDAGVCLGIQKRDHKVYNYNNYSEAEPGTEAFNRRLESELMIRAYNTCNKSMSGMEWTSKVEYRNKTADEWMNSNDIQLLPCEKTFYRDPTE